MNADLFQARERRRYFPKTKDPVSGRSAGRVDFDRLLYSPYFHRLSGVTQVVATTTETALVHNRMTHSLKVAQLSRELSETLVVSTDGVLLEGLGGLDPDVAATAGLAHDLGHPPFGHIAEQELDEILVERGFREGFDGNAQTLRIITLLAAKKNTLPAKPGLDLTAASRNAVLKYPLSYADFESVNGPYAEGERPIRNRRPKYGYYESDSTEFGLARECQKLAENSRSLECQVMDLCDDISYAVHDLEDFIRTGVITAASLATPPPAFETLVTSNIKRSFEKIGKAEHEAAGLAAKGFGMATGLVENDATKGGLLQPLQKPYRGTTEQQASLSALSSFYIESFLDSVSIRPKDDNAEISVEDGTLATILALKWLTRELVINRPSVHLAQAGQRKIIRTLFESVNSWLDEVFDPQHFPGVLAHIWDVNFHLYKDQHGKAGAEDRRSEMNARVTCDFIATLTESQAMSIFREVEGHSTSPVLGNWML